MTKKKEAVPVAVEKKPRVSSKKIEPVVETKPAKKVKEKIVEPVVAPVVKTVRIRTPKVKPVVAPVIPQVQAPVKKLGLFKRIAIYFFGE